MKKDRDLLEKNFNIILRDINANNNLFGEIINEFKKNNFDIGIDLLSGRIPIETLELPVIYNLVNIIYNVGEFESINPNSYFTDVEIKELKKSSIKKEIKKYPIVFENAVKINNEQYAFFLTAKEVTSLYNSSLIKYNFETQRNKKISKHKNQIIESVNINKNSVNEMAELMGKGRFFTNFITINLLQNGEDSFVFDAMNNELVIKAGELNILDGFHRCLAMLQALQKNSNTEYITGVYLTNFDVDNAKRYIVQEDKKNKISKKYIKSLDDDNLVNQVIKKINESSRCDLLNKITPDYNSVVMGISLVTWDTLQLAIEQGFSVKTRKDVMDVSNYLIDGFNEIIGSYPDIFIDNLKKNKLKYVHAYNNMFIGYVTILSNLYNSEDWRILLKEKLNNIDFSINNNIWDELGIKLSPNKITIKIASGIVDFFKGV